MYGTWEELLLQGTDRSTLLQSVIKEETDPREVGLSDIQVLDELEVEEVAVEPQVTEQCMLLLSEDSLTYNV